MKKVNIPSDYTPMEEVNYLQLIRDEQGDVHIRLMRNHDDERGVRIAASGGRHSPEVREALYQLIDVYEKELKETKRDDIKQLNS